MNRRIVIPDSFMRGKPHKDQLKAMAEDLLEHMRNNINDPRMFKTYAESFAIMSKLLSDDLPTEESKGDLKSVDVSAFEG
jgi:hypothetical protein